MKYVQHHNVIILAVCAANVDLALCDAIKVVKEVDPTGKPPKCQHHICTMTKMSSYIAVTRMPSLTSETIVFVE